MNKSLVLAAVIAAAAWPLAVKKKNQLQHLHPHLLLLLQRLLLLLLQLLPLQLLPLQLLPLQLLQLHLLLLQKLLRSNSFQPKKNPALRGFFLG